MADLELFDAHCHLDWLSAPARAATEARGAGLGMLAVTVTPAGYRAAVRELAGAANVAVAAGLHPWWVADGRCGRAEADELAALAAETRWVGEVGLDLSRAHGGGREGEHVCEACAGATRGDGRPRVLSVHAVRSAGAALDVLGRTGCLARCRVVFHWFSGTSEELSRAVRAGCWFSLGERSLATRRGREYARQLPADGLRNETDLPPAP